MQNTGVIFRSACFLGLFLMVGNNAMGTAKEVSTPHQLMHNPYNPEKEPYHYGYCQMMLQKSHPDGAISDAEAAAMTSAAKTILQVSQAGGSHCLCEQAAGAYDFLDAEWIMDRIPNSAAGDALKDIVDADSASLYSVTDHCSCAADVPPDSEVIQCHGQASR